MLTKTLTLFCLLLATVQITAQEKLKFKFGEITEKNFETKIYPVDSSAEAVILADIGTSEIVGNSKGWFSLRFKKYRRIHILNKNAFSLANVSVPYYQDSDDEEKLDKVKAVTYNIEGGKVVETKLEVKGNIFTDKISKNYGNKKFTLPNVKEGSIIEYEYVIESDFLQYLRPWEFQGSYPRLWSEYNLSLPNFLGYVFLTQGYRKYDISTQKERRENYRIIDSRGAGISDYYSLTSGVVDYTWVMKDVPALKEEGFTTSIDNHISKIEFQLSEYREPLTYRKIMATWPMVSTSLLNAEYFGQQVTKDNNWLGEYIGGLYSKTDNTETKARKIYEYVQKTFTCTDHSRLYMDQTLKNLVKGKNGTVSEINLLLTAMLRYADVNADPVILSTRNNGYTYSIYPLVNQYNYVIAKADIGGKEIYLDASETEMGFGRLPLRCYNGHARKIAPFPEALELKADSVSESKVSTVFIISGSKGEILGSITQTPGYYESLTLRSRINKNGKDKLLMDIGKVMGDEYKISNLNIDSLSKKDEPLGIKYDFDLETNGEDIIYFNPLLGEATKENPFKSAERFYPVEMPYKIDEAFRMQMEVPTGYEVDELPKSIVVKLNEEGDGMFEYRVSKSANDISFSTRIKIDRTYFSADEYNMLREFFNLIVSKHAEQIVFKKKK